MAAREIVDSADPKPMPLEPGTASGRISMFWPPEPSRLRPGGSRHSAPAWRAKLARFEQTAQVPMPKKQPNNDQAARRAAPPPSKEVRPHIQHMAEGLLLP